MIFSAPVQYAIRAMTYLGEQEAGKLSSIRRFRGRRAFRCRIWRRLSTGCLDAGWLPRSEAFGRRDAGRPRAGSPSRRLLPRWVPIYRASVHTGMPSAVMMFRARARELEVVRRR